MADLDEGPHLPALLPIPRGIVEDNVWGPDLLPGQPGVCDVVILGGVPHQEHIMPLSDDLTVGGHRLSSLILQWIFSKLFVHRLFILDHVDKVIEGQLEAHIDHVMWVGGGDDVITRRVVSEQVHWELDMVG